jgi:NAD(P)-dependent dehydrogenase (short-subunit alcohol dehydrogenase family)
MLINMIEKLKGKTAIVTGGAQGMGFAIADMLADNGIRVVVCDIKGENACAAAGKINAKGNVAHGIKVDVTDEQEVGGMIEETIERFGGIEILVNNAGILKPTRIEEISKKEWDMVLDVNLNGVFLCSKAVLPFMKKNNFGRIVNMSSSAGRSVSTLGGAHYTASKAGVLGLTRAMAKEISKYGITVNAVCPGLIDTEMVRHDCAPEKIKYYESVFPIPRLGTPQEVARLVLFLCIDSYITGASIDINGGDLMI